jgi:hypothetical protein
VTVALESGETEEIAVSSHTDYDALSPGERVPVQVTRLGDWVRITLDRGPRANKNATYLPVILLVGMLIWFGVSMRRKRAWYELSSLDESESGKARPA